MNDGVTKASNNAHKIESNILTKSIKKYLPINALKLIVCLVNAPFNIFTDIIIL